SLLKPKTPPLALALASAALRLALRGKKRQTKLARRRRNERSRVGELVVYDAANLPLQPQRAKVLDLVAITIVAFGFQPASEPDRATIPAANIHPAEIAEMVAAILIAISHVVGSLLGGPPKSESRMLSSTKPFERSTRRSLFSLRAVRLRFTSRTCSASRYSPSSARLARF
ncbi:hypothetical protein THAOC_23150, partial [Thalassiosira oceanica]